MWPVLCLCLSSLTKASPKISFDKVNYTNKEIGLLSNFIGTTLLGLLLFTDKKKVNNQQTNIIDIITIINIIVHLSINLITLLLNSYIILIFTQTNTNNKTAFTTITCIITVIIIIAATATTTAAATICTTIGINLQSSQINWINYITNLFCCFELLYKSSVVTFN